VTVEERIGLVFTWDPRPQHWVKERGPDDAPPPPADPIDNGAVQTYFLDPQTGRWNGTILGLKGRQISIEMGDKYRTPKMVGLAIIAKIAPKASAIPTPDQKKSNAVPMMAGIAAVVVVIAAGAFAAQAVMKPSAATASAAPTTGVVASAPVATTGATEAPAPTQAPTAAPTQAPVNTPVRTVAPTNPPPPPPVAQTVTFSARLSTGQTVTFSGPSVVNQGSVYSGVVSLRTPNGAPGSEQINFYFGPLGTAQGLTLNPDRNGNYTFALKVEIARGNAPISVQVGRNGELRTLGTVTVR
jgi:hypothetical protein